MSDGGGAYPRTDRDVLGTRLVAGDRVEVVGQLQDDGADEWLSMVGERGTVLLPTMEGVLVDFGRAVLCLPATRLRRCGPARGPGTRSG